MSVLRLFPLIGGKKKKHTFYGMFSSTVCLALSSRSCFLFFLWIYLKRKTDFLKGERSLLLIPVIIGRLLFFLRFLIKKINLWICTVTLHLPLPLLYEYFCTFLPTLLKVQFVSYIYAFSSRSISFSFSSGFIITQLSLPWFCKL